MSRNYRRQTIIVITTPMICVLLCSSTILSGLSSQSSILARDLATDAYAQEEVDVDTGTENTDTPQQEGGSETQTEPDESDQPDQPQAQPDNTPPQADASGPQEVNEGSQNVQLSGLGSSDVDNNILSFSWRQLQPSNLVVQLYNADTSQASFTAPQVESDTLFVFELTVRDSRGESDSDTVQVLVRNIPTMSQQGGGPPAPSSPSPAPAPVPFPTEGPINSTTGVQPDDNNTTIIPPSLPSEPEAGANIPCAICVQPDDSATNITGTEVKTTLTVITKVTGFGPGGTPAPAKPSDFTIRVYASNSVPFESQGSESGTTVSFDAGRYEVELYRGPDGYLQEFSGDCSGNIDPAAIADQRAPPKVCTITNTLINNAEFLSTLRVNVNINPTPPEPLDFQIQIKGTPATPAKFGVVMNDVKDVMVQGGSNYEVVSQNPVKGYSISYNATYSSGCKGAVVFQAINKCTITYDAYNPVKFAMGSLDLVMQVINDGIDSSGSIKTTPGTKTPSDFILSIVGKNNPSVKSIKVPTSKFGTQALGSYRVSLDPGVYDVLEYFDFGRGTNPLQPGAVGTVEVDGQRYSYTIEGDCNRNLPIEPNYIHKCIISHYDDPRAPPPPQAPPPQVNPSSVYGRGPKPTQPTTPAPLFGYPESCTPRTGGIEYGCYCGVGNTSPSFRGAPADALDVLCRAHDMEYGNCSVYERYNVGTVCFRKIAFADRNLCAGVSVINSLFYGQALAYMNIGINSVFCIDLLLRLSSVPQSELIHTVSDTVNKGYNCIWKWLQWKKC